MRRIFVMNAYEAQGFRSAAVLILQASIIIAAALLRFIRRSSRRWFAAGGRLPKGHATPKKSVVRSDVCLLN